MRIFTATLVLLASTVVTAVPTEKELSGRLVSSWS